MPRLTGLVWGQAGGNAPVLWGAKPSRFLVASVLGLAAVGCGKKDETRTLQPVQLGMKDDMAAVYSDKEISLYQVGRPVPFPVRQPTADEQAEINGQQAPPYPHMPFLQLDDSRVQITWTLTNLDAATHNVEVLIDPWNEFARYYPGMAVTDVEKQEQQPNFSGIQIMYELPGTQGDRPSHRVFVDAVLGDRADAVLGEARRFHSDLVMLQAANDEPAAPDGATDRVLRSAECPVLVIPSADNAAYCAATR